MARTTIATDDFNRASLGSDYTQVNASLGGNVSINSSIRVQGQYATQPVDDKSTARRVTETYSNDQFASMQIPNIDDGLSTDNRTGVAVRIGTGTDGSKSLYEAYVMSAGVGNKTIALVKWVSGTRTQLHSASVAFTNNDYIELECQGTTLTVCKNGTALGGSFTQTDSSLTTGKPGIVCGSTGTYGDNATFGDVTTAAPILSSSTGTPTGPTQATIGVTSDTTGSISSLILPAATVAPVDAATLIADGTAVTRTISTAGVATTFSIIGLTTNTAIKVHWAMAGSNVVSSSSFTPNTLAITGTTLSSQSGTAGATFTWAGATPESLITNTGNGSGSWSAISGVGASGATVNSSTGILVAATLGAVGSYTITLQRADGSTVPSVQTVTKTVGLTISASGAATTVTMSGPSSGTVSLPSTNFTIGADGAITGTIIVTPSDGGNGGVFTPATISISSGAPTGTFTYTPATTGTKTISVTNNGGLANPPNLSYSATSGTRTVTLSLTTDGTTPSANLTGLRWAFFDQVLPNLLTTPTATGTNGTTNSSGVITVNVTGTALSAGATGYLIVSDTNGSVTQSPACKAFTAPVLVT